MHEHSPSVDRRSALTGFTIGLLIVGLVVGLAACSDFGGKTSASSTESTAAPGAHSEALLSGHVVDSETGEPIPRVNIIRAYEGDEQSSQDGFGEGVVSTNEDGTFTAHELSPGSHKLIVSCVGYERKTKEITVTAGSPQTMRIELQRETKSLPEVEIEASGTE